MKQQIVDLLKDALAPMGVTGVEPAVEVPEDAGHGDYATNVAMAAFGKLKAQNSNVKWNTPLELALAIREAIIRHQNMSKLGWLDRVETAPPGFINLFLSEASLISQLTEVLKQKGQFGSRSFETVERAKMASKGAVGVVSKTRQKTGQKSPVIGQKSPEEPQKISRTKSAEFLTERQNKKIMVEFAHPNTHKAFHIGHLRNIATGESLVRLLESQGHEVVRANYQGDVGMHIAKCLYALTRISTIKNQLSKIEHEDVHEKVAFLGQAYAAGSKAFEGDPAAQAEIKDLNALIYASAQRFARETGIEAGTTDYLKMGKGSALRLPEVYALWKETRQWSLDYFDEIYHRVYTHYDRLYFESQCLAGVDAAKDAVTKGVLTESDGAIIFDGKPYQMDTRVFVNNLGLPTYEAKELALAKQEMSEFGHIDRLIHVVGPEQASFFRVTFKVEELLGLVEPGVQYHLAYGWVRLKKGKMSSRLGNVVLGEWLLEEAKKSIYKILETSRSSDYSKKLRDEIAEKAAVAAVKYSFLRVGVTNEIAFDLEASVSFEGDSGPYLQYTYARCRSVLRKAGPVVIASEAKQSQFLLGIAAVAEDGSLAMTLNPEERSVARLIAQFPDVVAAAAQNFAPNLLCTYLFKLAQAFNLFYAKHTILGEPSAVSPPAGEAGRQPSANQKAESRKLTAESSLRLALTAATAQVLANGLYLLGIATLEQM